MGSLCMIVGAFVIGRFLGKLARGLFSSRDGNSGRSGSGHCLPFWLRAGRRSRRFSLVQSEDREQAGKGNHIRRIAFSGYCRAWAYRDRFGGHIT